jgi:multidrug efflux pump subunit AcrB
MKRRRIVVLSYLVISGATIFLVGGALGTEIFPVVDTGQFQLHLRAPPGTRIERTEQIALQTLDAIKREVGPDNVEVSLGFVGTQPPNYPINTIYLWSSGSEEAVLQVQLKRGTQIGIEDLQERLRQKLPQELPNVRFSFEPSDIVSRVMSFGAPTPIEVAVSGPNLADTRQYADKLRAKLAQVPTLRDLGFEQELKQFERSTALLVRRGHRCVAYSSLSSLALGRRPDPPGSPSYSVPRRPGQSENLER